MVYQLKCAKLTRADAGAGAGIIWNDLEASTVFVPARGVGGGNYKTTVQCAWDESHLYVHFYCEDDEVVANLQCRDDPLYNEDVVEVFLAPSSLNRYYEFNLSPRNVVFDSLVSHDGTTFLGRPEWDCLGLKHEVRRRSPGQSSFGDWEGFLAVPFMCLGILPAKGQSWRANFYRIKRGEPDRYLAWSPTFVEPVSFHIPSRFGELLFL